MPRSGHIAQLRRHVGTGLLLVPSVSVLLTDGHGRLLLLHHQDGSRWGTPGGAVEPGEHPADAAVREAWEETGLHVQLTGIVGVFGGPEHRLVYDNGDVTAYVSTAFSASVVGGLPRPGAGEIDQLRWIGPDERETVDVAPFVREVLDAGFAYLETDAPQPYFAPARWSPPRR